MQTDSPPRAAQFVVQGRRLYTYRARQDGFGDRIGGLLMPARCEGRDRLAELALDLGLDIPDGPPPPGSLGQFLEVRYGESNYARAVLSVSPGVGGEVTGRYHQLNQEMNR